MIHALVRLRRLPDERLVKCVLHASAVVPVSTAVRLAATNRCGVLASRSGERAAVRLPLQTCSI